jgi:tetratricopeptide (TPR) repeat protein
VLLTLGLGLLRQPGEPRPLGGLVLDEEDRPVTGATVSASAGGDTVTGQTDEHGHFQLDVRAESQSNVTFTVMKAGYENGEKTTHPGHTGLSLVLKRKPSKEGLTEEQRARDLQREGDMHCQKESVEDLALCLDRYEQALKLLPREKYLAQWAALQERIGTVQAQLGERRNVVSHLESSVAALRSALEAQNREADEQDWARRQYKLGKALGMQASKSTSKDEARLRSEAVDAFQLALEVRTREAHEQEWASTQHFLGLNLRELGELTRNEEGTRLLSKAVEAFRLVLEVRTRETHEQDWAETQHLLGKALRQQGQHTPGEEGTRLLSEAVEAFRHTLEVRTRESHGQRWGDTQYFLGGALRLQGERTQGEEGTRLLSEAVDAYQSALEVFKRDAQPGVWADTQHWLGKALQAQGKRTQGKEGEVLRSRGGNALRLAQEVRSRQVRPQD